MPPRRPREDGLSQADERLLEDAIKSVRGLAPGGVHANVSRDRQIQIAREAIAIFESTGFAQGGDLRAQRLSVTRILQRLAFDSENHIAGDIAQWCMGQWLALLQRNAEDLAALRGQSNNLPDNHRLTYHRPRSNMAGTIAKRSCQNTPGRWQRIKWKQWQTTKSE
jgi:hypothetical protein